MRLKTKLLINVLVSGGFFLLLSLISIYIFYDLGKGFTEIIENGQSSAQSASKTNTEMKGANQAVSGIQTDMNDIGKMVSTANLSMKILERKITDISGRIKELGDLIEKNVKVMKSKNLPKDIQNDLLDIADEISDIQDRLQREGLISLQDSTKQMNSANDKIQKQITEMQNISTQITGVTELSEIQNTSATLIRDKSIGFKEMISSSSKSLIVLSLVMIVIMFAVARVLYQSMIGPLESATSELSEVSSIVSSQSNKIESAGKKISDQSASQAESLTQTSASLEELTQMIKKNLEGAQESFCLAIGAQGICQQSGQSMEQLLSSMKALEESTQKMSQLLSIMAKIKDKTSVIDEIVFQTKLLSFNASVEAERAGEHGRGFSIVAQEVGSLAIMSGKAAGEISTIVEQSLALAGEIVQENLSKAKQGSRYANEASSVIFELISTMGKVVVLSEQILKASNEQANGINQIDNAISSLDQTSKVNSKVSYDLSHSAKEMNDQIHRQHDVLGKLLVMMEGKQAS